MQHVPLRHTGHVDVEAEESASQRLRFARRGVETFPCGCRVDGTQIVAGKRDLRHIGAGKADFHQQFTLGRIPPCAPACEQSRPQAAFAVHCRPIGIARAILDADENALVRQRAARPAVESVDDAPERIGVVQDAAVRAEGRAVGDHISRIDFARAAVFEAMKTAARMFLAVVHGAEPEIAFSVDRAVVEPVAQLVRLNPVAEREGSRLRAEGVQPRLEAGDEIAVRQRGEESRLRRRIPAARLAGLWIETVDLLLLDVDEPQRGVARRPQRPFTQLGAKRPGAFGPRAHRQPASIQYSWPVHMRPSSEARKRTSAATCCGSTRSFRHC
jgi:hypothetical protein